MSGQQNGTGPLGRVKILSFAQVGVGPAAVQLLADLGADVIKVERPGLGAWERSWAGPSAFIEGESLFFLGFNRNQRSLTLNLKSDAGKSIARRLAERADVVMENFRPGVMEELGLGHEELSRVNPGVIYCSANGFGPRGPYHRRPGQDLILQAESGLTSITGRKQDPPTPAGAPIIDMHAAALLALGTVTALFSREATNRGQKVETSLLEAALHLQLEPLVYHLNGRWLRDRSEAGIASTYHQAPYGIYQTQDGHIALSIIPLAKLADALDLDRLRSFSDEDVSERPDEIKPIIEETLKMRTSDDWISILLAHDIWCGRVNTYDDLEEHPQLQAMEVFCSLEHPRAGTIKTLSHPVRYGETHPLLKRSPPLLGQHTHEVLSELGFSQTEIEKLSDEGVV